MTDKKSMFQIRLNDFFEKAKDKNHDLTIEEFANSIGATKGAFRGWLSGAGEPKLEKFKEIAEKLNTSPHYLMGVTDDPTPPKISPTGRDIVRIGDNKYQFYENYQPTEIDQRILDAVNESELDEEEKERILPFIQSAVELVKSKKKTK